MHLSLNWMLVVAGAALILLEVVMGAATGFDFLLIGSAILLGGLLGLATGSPAIGAATAGVLALLYVFVGRRRVRGRLVRPGLKSNTDALIGRTAQVVAAIESDRAGRVRIEGEEWRALPAVAPSPALQAGSSARIVRVDGVTMYVQSVDTPEGATS